MNPTDTDLGIPSARPQRTEPKTVTPPEPIVETELRPGENELGRPVQAPRTLAPLSDEDRKRIHQDEIEQQQREIERMEEMVSSDPAVLRWAGWFAHPLAVALLLSAIGVLGLYLTSQTLTILSNLATQPPLVMYAGYALLALLASLILYAMSRFGLLYFRLRQNRQINLQGLEELSQRTKMRWLVHARSQEARQQLETYLKSYPLDPRKSPNWKDQEREQMTRMREKLLDPTHYSSSQEWFETFRKGFQGPLDAAADARIRYWSNRAWVVTALAPNGLYDSLATTYFGFAMITDLCGIYNLRAGRTGTAVLLGRVFFNAYLSGQVGDWEKLAEDQYDQLFLEAFHTAGITVGTSAAGKILGKVGAKATTGYLNRVLLMRLGNFACRLLRPVA